ncbi:unnamed protein product [Paramecium octaurelia]|uniref:Uncharacterized protein n=1 Tax=Paramecium octaurelia TaxID=43137 RepID=A0A8S1V2Y1_PAROT|nr:unnamed protein product [Paramecium octaurelia]
MLHSNQQKIQLGKLFNETNTACFSLSLSQGSIENRITKTGVASGKLYDQLFVLFKIAEWCEILKSQRSGTLKITNLHSIKHYPQQLNLQGQQNLVCKSLSKRNLSISR